MTTLASVRIKCHVADRDAKILISFKTTEVTSVRVEVKCVLPNLNSITDRFVPTFCFIISCSRVYELFKDVGRV